MNNPFLKSLKFRLLFTGIWVMIIITQILMNVYYFERTDGLNILSEVLDSITGNILQSLCIIGLWIPVKYYRNFKSVPLFLVFHFTLFLISSVIWIGLGYLINQSILFSNNIQYNYIFFATLPVKIVFGLLVYIIFVLTYYLLIFRNECKMQKQNIVESVENASVTPVEKLTRVIVKKNSEFHCININQIRYIEANGDYVLIYTDSNKFLKDQPMKYWETHLPDDNFVRIHRSFIVNIEVIAKMELYEKETYKIHLKNGDILKASSSGYKLLKQKMRL